MYSLFVSFLWFSRLTTGILFSSQVRNQPNQSEGKNSVTNLLFVGLGGATGSILRYLASRWAERLFPAVGLPVGTFAVNVVGCLLLGFLAGLSESRDLVRAEVRLLLMVGLLGGFTTFSTFSNETLDLAKGSDKWLPFAYVGASVMLGVLSAWIGNAVGRSV